MSTLPQSDTEQKSQNGYSVELLEEKYLENDDWGFVAYIVGEVTHPYGGEPVHLHNIFTAYPKKDDVLEFSDKIYHKQWGYWPCINIHRKGAGPFFKTATAIHLDEYIKTTNEIYDQCLSRVTGDPRGKIETLREYDETVRERIDGEYEPPLIDLSHIDEGDTFTVKLHTGEVFENITVTDCSKHFAESGNEETTLIFTLRGDIQERVQDRSDSNLLSIKQKSDPGGEPLHYPSLYGLEIEKDENGNVKEDAGLNHILFGDIIDLKPIN